jgi:hypothetical protein
MRNPPCPRGRTAASLLQIQLDLEWAQARLPERDCLMCGVPRGAAAGEIAVMMAGYAVLPFVNA